jgi:hypothetical protein
MYGIAVIAAMLLALDSSHADAPHGSVRHMRPLWTLDAESDAGPLVGRVGDVVVDAEGNIYALDVQMRNIKVFDADGVLLRVIGREGDGPGELRAPTVLAFMADSTLGVVAGRSGRVSKFDARSGEPRGELLVGGLRNARVHIEHVVALPPAAGDRLVAAVVRETVRDEAEPMRWGHWSYLALYRDDGSGGETFPLTRLLDVGEVRGTDQEVENYYRLWTPWTVDALGRIVAAPFWSSYVIRYYDPAGELAHQSEFAFEGRDRREFEKRRFLDVLWGGVSPESYGIRLETSATEAVVRAIYPTEDGGLWVQTSESGLEADKGVFMVLDVIGADGRAQHKLRIIGPGDEFRDRVRFGPNGLMVVYRSTVPSRPLEEETDGHGVPLLSVYRLVPGHH